MSRFKWLEFENKPGGENPSGNPATPPDDGFAGPGQKLPFESETAGIDMTDPAQVLHLAEKVWRRLEYEKALKLYSKVLSLDPNIEAGWVGQLRCLIDLQENPEALTWAKKAQKMFPKSADVMSAYALATARQGDLREAMSFSDGAMKNDRIVWYPWVVRGEILALSGAPNADLCMMKAREAMPNDPFVTLKVAQAYARTPMFEKAVPLFAKALGSFPDLPEAWFEFGQVQLEIGFLEPAREAFARANKLAPVVRKYSDAYSGTLTTNPLYSLWGWLKQLWKGVTGS